MIFDQQVKNTIESVTRRENIKSAISCQQSAEMLKTYLRGIDSLPEVEITKLHLVGGLELQSVDLIRLATREIKDNPDVIPPVVKTLLKLNRYYIGESDPEFKFAFGDFLEITQMYHGNAEICKTIRKLYSNLPDARMYPFYFKVKRIGTKAYSFANYEINNLKQQLEQLLDESERRGTKEDIAYCNFYLGLLLYKIPDNIAYDAVRYFRVSQKACELASANYIQEYINAGIQDDYDCSDPIYDSCDETEDEDMMDECNLHERMIVELLEDIQKIDEDDDELEIPEQNWYEDSDEE